MAINEKINGKIIFVTGGVLSSLGKGIFSASLGSVFKERNLKVNIMKFDPYLNVDPGTISPIEHGEVFVTANGGETDLDIGHYERFLDQELDKNSSVSSGKIYLSLIDDERKGKYLGNTVQIVPHVINKIIDRVLDNLKGFNLLIVEIGGTVGDIESLPYFEAIRQLQFQRENVIVVHMGYVPFLNINNEFKSKPFQHSVKQLQGLGIFPNLLILRSENEVPDSVIEKISSNCSVSKDLILKMENVDNVFLIPQKLVSLKVDYKIAKLLNLKIKYSAIKNYEFINNLVKNKNGLKLKVGIIGKYFELQDSYLSIIETLKIISLHKLIETKVVLLDAKNLNVDDLKNLDGIIIPGGFGVDGTNGKLSAIEFARINNVPLLAICYGLQLSILEFARNVLKLNVYHQEINPEKKDFIIHLLKEQDLENLGGTMRLGDNEIKILKNTITSKIYNKKTIKARHRHRYEFNNIYKKDLEKAGIVFSGINPENNLVEIIEYPKNDFFIATQFHPEFNTTLYTLDKLFLSFVEVMSRNVKKRIGN